MFKSCQKGFTPIFLLLIIAGIIVGVYLVQTRTNLLPKASTNEPFTQEYKKQFVPNELIIKFQPNILDNDREKFLVSLQKRLKEERGQNNIKLGIFRKLFDSDNEKLRYFYSLTFLDNPNLEQIRSVVTKEFGQVVENIGPNYYLKIQQGEVFPNDPQFVSNSQSALSRIKMPEAWGLIDWTGSQLVGVLDSGIDADHEDFSAETILPGKNYSEYGSNPADISDREGHGTAVSGLIVATANNNLGIAGVAWNLSDGGRKNLAAIVPYKVANDQGVTTFGSLARAIVDISGFVKIINLSFGIPLNCDSSQAGSDAVRQALRVAIEERRRIVIAAAGNNNIDRVSFPANCEGVIAVGATDSNDQRLNLEINNRKVASNFGDRIDISAPGAPDMLTSLRSGKCGVDPLTTCNINSLKTDDNNYIRFLGTSAATPQVSAAVAIILSKNSSLSPETVKRCLIENSDKEIPGFSEVKGRLNVLKIVQALKNNDSSCRD